MSVRAQTDLITPVTMVTVLLFFYSYSYFIYIYIVLKTSQIIFSDVFSLKFIFLNHKTYVDILYFVLLDLNLKESEML